MYFKSLLHNPIWVEKRKDVSKWRDIWNKTNAFHISDLAFCFAAYNTCIIIMRLLIHHGEYKAIVVPCHHYGMFKSLFPGVSFRVVGVGVGVFGWCVNSILSASNKQLVTLKFDTSAICFLLSGETIFSWNLRLSAISHPFCRFSLNPREGNEQQKGHFARHRLVS